jgi:DNA-binding response OmpR family regulator
MLGTAPAHPPRQRARVLVVEDEPGIAGPFAAALEREGFVPAVAGTAAAARAALDGAAFDLVVLDLALPDGDGRDLCRELRRASDLPILMLTARGTEADRVVGLELGADDYVVKPFSAAEVAARIRAILRRGERAAAGAPQRLRAGALEVDLDARRVWRASSTASRAWTRRAAAIAEGRDSAWPSSARSSRRTAATSGSIARPKAERASSWTCRWSPGGGRQHERARASQPMRCRTGVRRRR